MLYEPYVIESFNRSGERSYPLFSRLLKDRIILVSGEITEDISTVVCSQLLYLEQQDPETPIFMYINSPGGSVTAGLAIYDTMTFISNDVYTIAMGEACSMGSFLLSAGAQRYSLPNTTLMYHSVSSGFSGTIQDHEIEYKETVRLQNILVDKLVEISSQHTNGQTDKEYFQEKIKRNWYMTPQEALELGLIDKVIYKRKDVPK